MISIDKLNDLELELDNLLEALGVDSSERKDFDLIYLSDLCNEKLEEVRGSAYTEGFEAGQESRDEEVETLKNRITDLEWELEEAKSR